MVCGAVKREYAHVEPLGKTGRPAKLAHCLRALKEGLDTLRMFLSHNSGPC